MKEKLAALLKTERFGRPFLLFDSVDSTNSEAKRRADEGAEEGLLILSEEQTAGRGRRGRAWTSAKGEGICMSLLLRPNISPDRASQLTLVMGLAVCDALREACGLEAQIKWPNDIVCDGKKVCGILTEMSAAAERIRYVVIGVGINVDTDRFPDDLARLATSIRQQTGAETDRASLIAALLGRFEEDYDLFLDTRDLSNLKDRYNAHLINRGREVCILDDTNASDETGGSTGIAQGIDSRGALLVATSAGERKVTSGEVSVRGVYGYV